MLRALLVIVALAIIAAIVAVSTGWVSLYQTRTAQAPAYGVKVKQIELGTTTTNVTVPTVTTTTKQVETPTVHVSDGNSAH